VRQNVLTKKGKLPKKEAFPFRKDESFPPFCTVEATDPANSGTLQPALYSISKNRKIVKKYLFLDLIFPFNN
jgi:hypothetical protein